MENFRSLCWQTSSFSGCTNLIQDVMQYHLTENEALFYHLKQTWPQIMWTQKRIQNTIKQIKMELFAKITFLSRCSIADIWHGSENVFVFCVWYFTHKLKNFSYTLKIWNYAQKQLLLQGPSFFFHEIKVKFQKVALRPTIDFFINLCHMWTIIMVNSGQKCIYLYLSF